MLHTRIGLRSCIVLIKPIQVFNTLVKPFAQPVLAICRMVLRRVVKVIPWLRIIEKCANILSSISFDIRTKYVLLVPPCNSIVIESIGKYYWSSDFKILRTSPVSVIKYRAAVF
jgi:hypothetical protein